MFFYQIGDRQQLDLALRVGQCRPRRKRLPRAADGFVHQSRRALGAGRDDGLIGRVQYVEGPRRRGGLAADGQCIVDMSSPAGTLPKLHAEGARLIHEQPQRQPCCSYHGRPSTGAATTREANAAYGIGNYFEAQSHRRRFPVGSPVNRRDGWKIRRCSSANWVCDRWLLVAAARAAGAAFPRIATGLSASRSSRARRLPARDSTARSVRN